MRRWIRMFALLAAVLQFLSEARAELPSAFCAGLLSEGQESPAAALAEAWARIAFDFEVADADRVAGWVLNEIVPVVNPEARIAAALDPPAGLYSLDAEDGFGQLRGIKSLLVAQNGLDAAVLAGEIEQRALEVVRAREDRREVEEETRGERRRSAEAIRRVRGGERIGSEILRTRSGTLVVSARNALLFFAEDGRLLKRQSLSGFIDGGAIELRDGRIAVGTFEGELATYDQNGDFIDVKFLEGVMDSGGAELLDGTIVMGTMEGYVHFLRPDGTRKKYVTMGEILSPPLALPNGDCVVASNDGALYFLDSQGKKLKKVGLGNGISRTPVLLDDGNLVAVSQHGDGRILNLQGKVLRKFQVGMNATRPVQLKDGRVATASWYGDGQGGWNGRIDFLRPDGKPAGPALELDSPLHSELTLLSNGTFVFVDNAGHLRSIDADGDSLFRMVLKEQVFSRFLELGDGRIVVGAGNGELLFVSPSDLPNLEF